jgi:hypothetical protein
MGGHGGIVGVDLDRDTLSIRLTADKVAQMGGFDELCVRFSLTDEGFDVVSDELRRVFVGYEAMVRIPNHASRIRFGIRDWGSVCG